MNITDTNGHHNGVLTNATITSKKVQTTTSDSITIMLNQGEKSRSWNLGYYLIPGAEVGQVQVQKVQVLVLAS